MKRNLLLLFFAIIAFLCVALGFTACGDGNNVIDGSNNNEEQVKDDGKQSNNSEHKLVFVSAKSASCIDSGNLSYYTCSHCDKWFKDSGATTEISDKSTIIIEPLGHTPQVIEGIEATCISTGLTEGSQCSVCQIILVSQTETPKIDHNYKKGFCTVCHLYKPTDGLAYTLSADGAYYTVSGIGTATDTDIYIGYEYNDLPI
jgi:hypothetical protein